MFRVSVSYISLVIILSFFFAFITLKDPNFFNQFNTDIKSIYKPTSINNLENFPIKK